MPDGLTILGLVLAALALCERRVWPFVAIVSAVWLCTEVTEYLPDRITGLQLRVPIDFAGGAISLFYIVRHRVGQWVTALFALMLMNHATYWLAYANGVNVWVEYAHMLNALWLIQLAVLAVPGGMNGVLVGLRLGRVFIGWCRGLGMGVGEVGTAHRACEDQSDGNCYRRSDVGAYSGLHLSKEA